MPTPLNDLPSQRILSVDAFRGLTFLLMLFVNFLAGATQIPAGIHHVAADVDGMGLADIVFPAFMFAVGMSIPFGINSRLARSTSGNAAADVQLHVAYRALSLVAMGVFMVNAESGYNEAAMGMRIDVWALLFYAAVLLVWGVYRFDSVTLNRVLRVAGVALLAWLAAVYRGGAAGDAPMAAQWWGILGLIGWAYLVAAWVYQLARGRCALLCGAIALCALGYPLAAASGQGMGFAVHATHAAIVLAGTVCALLFFDGARARFGAAALFGAALAAAGALLHLAYPVSKIGATPPWALYTAALCTALFAGLYWLIELRQARSWTRVVEPAASNPLITYLLPFVLGAVMHLAGLRWPAALTTGAGAIAFAVVFSFGVVLLVAGLNKRNIKLKI